jgi:hypothetical protein
LPVLGTNSSNLKGRKSINIKTTGMPVVMLIVYIIAGLAEKLGIA